MGSSNYRKTGKLWRTFGKLRDTERRFNRVARMPSCVVACGTFTGVVIDEKLRLDYKEVVQGLNRSILHGLTGAGAGRNAILLYFLNTRTLTP